MKYVGKIVPTLTSAICFGLMGCDQGSSPEATTGTDENSVEVIQPPGTASANYKALADQLDAGGVFYGIMDVEGDAERLTEMAKGFYEMMSGEEGAGIPQGLDIEGIVRELGLHGVDGIGMSSVKDATDRFLNKSFLYTPDGREGLLNMMGGAAGAFKAPSFAPADTDLLGEQQFQLKALLEVAQGISDKIEIEGEKPLEEMLNMPIPNFSMTVSELVGQLNGRMIVAATLVDGETIVIPNDPEVEVPAVDMVICLEDLGWLFGKLQEMLPPEEAGFPIDREETDAFVKLTMQQIPVPHPSLERYLPVVYFEKSTERILIATTQTYLDRCLSSESKIESNDAYKAMFAGLPTEGNSMFYVSSRVMGAFETTMRNLAEANTAPTEGAYIDQMMNMMSHQLGATSSVTANIENGTITITRGPQSHKATLMQMTFFNPTTLLIGSSLVTPLIMQRQMMGGGDWDDQMMFDEGGADVMAMNSMQQVLTAIQMYSVDHEGSAPENLMDLVPDYIDAETSGELLNTVTADGVTTPLLYFPAGPDAPAERMIIAAPEPNEFGQRVIGLSDGTIMMVTDDEFLVKARDAMGASLEEEADPFE